MFLEKRLKAINYTQCCGSDSDQFVCVVDYLGNFTKGVKYLCRTDGENYFEVEDDYSNLCKVHRKCFKTKTVTNCLQLDIVRKVYIN